MPFSFEDLPSPSQSQQADFEFDTALPGPFSAEFDTAPELLSASAAPLPGHQFNPFMNRDTYELGTMQCDLPEGLSQSQQADFNFDTAPELFSTSAAPLPGHQFNPFMNRDTYEPGTMQCDLPEGLSQSQQADFEFDMALPGLSSASVAPLPSHQIDSFMTRDTYRPHASLTSDTNSALPGSFNAQVGSRLEPGGSTVLHPFGTTSASNKRTRFSVPVQSNLEHALEPTQMASVQDNQTHRHGPVAILPRPEKASPRPTSINPWNASGLIQGAELPPFSGSTGLTSAYGLGGPAGLQRKRIFQEPDDQPSAKRNQGKASLAENMPTGYYSCFSTKPRHQYPKDSELHVVKPSLRSKRSCLRCHEQKLKVPYSYLPQRTSIYTPSNMKYSALAYSPARGARVC